MKRTNWLDELLASLPPSLEGPQQGDPDPWHFDPHRDSVGDLMGHLESLCRDEADKWPSDDEVHGSYQQMADGLAWLQVAVGLDFNKLQVRWNKIDLILVEKHVSEKHSLDDPRGLFVYLDQIRLAHVIGADLAAIAMCPATTELLLRRHYAPLSGEDDKLHSLITVVEKKFKFLKDHNLRDKVKEANDILHNVALADNVREFPRRYVVLVREWVKSLQKMIHEAPGGSSDSPPTPVRRLTHIIDAIERIRCETAGVPLEAFESDWRKRWMVERGVEVICEASLHLNEELKARHPKIPWLKLAGMLDALRDYEHVKPKVLWDVATNKLGDLESACRAELTPPAGA
jgi:uncharacterized protein with HEPN domain